MVLLWLSITVLLAAPLVAQSTSAQITGTVRDPSSAVVPGAAVIVVNTATGVERQTMTAETGGYTVTMLQPGSYRVNVQKAGFRPVSRSGITLQVDQVARLDFTLEIGTTAETVEVVASAALVESETSSLGQVVDNQKILNLPLNGRMTFRLVQLTPGVITSPGSNGQFGDISVGTFDDVHFSINGGRAQSNSVMVDGVPASTGFLNLFTNVPSVDATQEFKVQSNGLSAEWGRFGGGVLNVSTRAGTNEIHGSLFEFLRNSAFDANEFFNNRAGRAKPPFRMNQLGGAVGGPLVRNRTFFFANYEATRWRRGDVLLTTVATDLERQGNFTRSLNNTGEMIVVYDPTTTRSSPSAPGQLERTPFPGNILPANRLDAAGKNLVGFYPQPNTTGDPLTQTNNFISNEPRRIDKDDGAIRIDHDLTSSYRMFGRFAVTRNSLHQPDTFRNEATPGVGANGDILFHYYTGAFDNTVTLSPTLLLNIRYGFARFHWARETRSYGFDQTKLGFPASMVNQLQIPVFPVVNVEGYSAMGGGSFIRTGQDTHSLLPSLTKITGRHNLKFGGDFRLRRNNLWIISNGGATYSFARNFTRGPDPNRFYANSGHAVASLLLGTAGGGSVNTVPGVSLQNWYVGGYFQDDIRINSRLTVNLGLRYESESPYTERRDQLGWFNVNLPSPVRNSAYPNLTGGLEFVAVQGHSRYPYSWDKNNFAPRAGFAWTIAPKTVLRAGAGLFYAPLETNNNLNTYSPVNGIGYTGTTPFVSTLDGLTPFRYLNNPFPEGLQKPTGNSLGAATLLGQAVASWDYAARTPYIWQWNVDIQHQLSRDLLIDVAYAASKGTRLARGYNFDALDPVYLSLGAGLQQLVDNPFYGQITVGALAQPRVARRQLLLPYPQFNGVDIINSGSASSIYHSLQVKLEKRLAQGYSFLVSYTGGKLITDSNNYLAGLGVQSNNTGVQDWYNLRAERAISEMDMSRAFAASFVAELPFGKGKRWLSGTGFAAKIFGDWQLSGIFSHKSGTPLVMSAPVTGGGNRPHSAGRSAALDQSRSRDEQIRRWFDTTAFLLPDPFTYGNVSRTLGNVRGPTLTGLDSILARNLTFKERVDLQIRWEVFNVLNTPHFWLPNTAFGSLQFGQISATQITALPRVMQFALKLGF
jgi:hypothetical protein